VDLPAVLADLRATHGVKRLVCEGGPTLLRLMLAADLVDEIYLTFCPRIFGGAGVPALTGPAGEFFARSIRARLVHFEIVGDECFSHYRVVREAHASDKAFDKKPAAAKVRG